MGGAMGGAIMGIVPGWRRLGLAWASLLLIAGAGIVTLQALGPLPDGVAVEVSAPPAVMPHATTNDPHAEASAQAPVVEPTAPGPPKPLISPPDPALLDPSRAFPPAKLPRIGPDGRLARIVYAAPIPAAQSGLPRVALLVGGFGLSEREGRVALGQLPAPVSLAVSSVANVPALLTAAREAGHELLVSIPMEPRGYPLNDEGVHSLQTGLPPEDNRTNLEWALSRVQGAVGATGASDGMRGERFAEIAALYDPMVDEITRRGLLYVDARPGRTAPAGAPVRAIDVVLDDQPGRAEVDARLQALERTARESGAAIGLLGTIRPATLERLVAWANGLPDRGLVLVPVSAIINAAAIDPGSARNTKGEKP